ncbi:MAG: UDP-3-O-(3-hydroxymyristoyl)glucosamine N-acyltransferase [Candidatus Accumulibacter sp.]|jgi:UDP-3-O-[3-hydroxymyristoyl] glucosamine N-acyltransferase|nr:UDP-3-O-(3-hydroxymyristoyl)glucosamine N-acyltransferase [Accumulibacter sp.]
MSTNKGIRLDEIADRFGGRIEGDGSVVVHQVASLESARSGQLAFLTAPKFLPLLKATLASAVIVPPQFSAETALPRIVHANPYACYARVVALLNPVSHEFSGVDPSAVVQSEIPPSTRVGALAVVGRRVELGENVTIYPGCVVGDDVSIGDDSILYARVVVYSNCRIGKRAILQSGAVIGGDGFGFAKDGDSWVKIPQIGRVVIGDDVEVGVNTAVDRGALDDTVIGNGVKLDNLIQIAHNVQVGDNTAMAGCAGIAGSTKIGERCTFGGAAMISGHIEIGDDVHISGGTFVAKSLGKPGVYTSIFPLGTHEEWLRNAVQIRRLARLAERVAELEKKIKPTGE